MRWLETGGRDFFFFYPDRAGPVVPDRFYTCNVSVKRALFRQAGGFDESFSYASHEDLEMGMRLARQGGMRLHYEPTLLACHEHPLTPASGLRRVTTMGMSAVHYWQCVADASSGWKTRLRPVLLWIGGSASFGLAHRILCRFARRESAGTWLWWLMLAGGFWLGAGTQWRKQRRQRAGAR